MTSLRGSRRNENLRCWQLHALTDRSKSFDDTAWSPANLLVLGLRSCRGALRAVHQKWIGQHMLVSFSTDNDYRYWRIGDWSRCHWWHGIHKLTPRKCVWRNTMIKEVSESDFPILPRLSLHTASGLSILMTAWSWHRHTSCILILRLSNCFSRVVPRINSRPNVAAFDLYEWQLC